MESWRMSTKTYGVTCQKTVVFIFPALKNLKSCSLYLYLVLLIFLLVIFFHYRMNSDEARVFNVMFKSR